MVRGRAVASPSPSDSDSSRRVRSGRPHRPPRCRGHGPAARRVHVATDSDGYSCTRYLYLLQPVAVHSDGEPGSTLTWTVLSQWTAWETPDAARALWTIINNYVIYIRKAFRLHCSRYFVQYVVGR